jgi:hypothetical protein
MAITTFMNIDLPTVSTTLGPEWATKLNAGLTTVDEHDHTSGKGTQIPTAGININANLSFNSFKPIDLLSTQYDSQVSALSGASNANSVFVLSGDLYFTNGSGTAVQVTTGTSLVSSPATFSTLEFTSINSNLTISPSDTFVFIAVDTGASRTIDLPLAANVSQGRVYAIKDSTGTANANPITIARQGSDLIDGATSFDFDSNYGSIWYITDGVSNWYRF